MLGDTRPVSYRYSEAATILNNLGFACVKKKGSHCKWRRKSPAGETVVVELVDSGGGTLKAYLIRDLVSQLRKNNLVPPGLE